MLNGPWRSVLLLLLLLALACAPERPPAPVVEAAPVRTHQPRYKLRPGPYGPETTIVTTFTAPRTVHILHCNGALALGLQKRDGGTWANAWVAETNACLSPPIVLPAGGRHTAAMTPIRIPPGTYRAVWFNVLTSFDRDRRPFGDELPLEQRASAPFAIQ